MWLESLYSVRDINKGCAFSLPTACADGGRRLRLLTVLLETKKEDTGRFGTRFRRTAKGDYGTTAGAARDISSAGEDNLDCVM